ncbi:hypothetical protein AB0I00_29545 [Streptomyces sp. NPDC050803]|uniref:hypothetical protein n=1 Tax=unclassified Streptomyces TaxID=2593676 RepID=UPI003421111D
MGAWDGYGLVLETPDRLEDAHQHQEAPAWRLRPSGRVGARDGYRLVLETPDRLEDAHQRQEAPG